MTLRDRIYGNVPAEFFGTDADPAEVYRRARLAGMDAAQATDVVAASFGMDAARVPAIVDRMRRTSDQ